MGDIADDHINRMLDEDHFWGGGCPRYNRPKKKKPPSNPAKVIAHEYPGKSTPAHLLQDYPEKTFDMSNFPTSKPKESSPWDIPDEAPF